MPHIFQPEYWRIRRERKKAVAEKKKAKPKKSKLRENFDSNIANQRFALKNLEEKSQILWTRNKGLIHKINALGIESNHLVLNYPELFHAEVEYSTALWYIFTLNEKKQRRIKGIKREDLQEQSLFADTRSLLSLVRCSEGWLLSKEYQRYKLSWLNLSKTVTRAEEAEKNYIKHLISNKFLKETPFK